MTREERLEFARGICRKITDHINEISPPGLGFWQWTWELVEEPSSRFLEALDVWVQDDTPDARDAVKSWASTLVVTWAEAVEAFRAEGRVPSEDQPSALV